MKRALIILLTVWAGLWLAACGSDDSPTSGQTQAPAPANAGPQQQPVRVSMGSDLLTLDPHLQLESVTSCILHNIFEPLTDLDKDIQLVPCLAQSWENTSPTQWVFHLRPGVKFQQGQPLTSADVIYSIRRALDWPLSRLKSEISTIDQAEAVDELTVRITTRQPDSLLPVRLAALMILDEESTRAGLQANATGPDDQSWLSTHANGTGPYTVGEWRRDSHCRLQASPTYWGGTPQVQTLEFVPVSNQATRMANLLRGGLDIAVDVPPRDVEKIEKSTGLRLVRQPSLRLIYLGLDTGRDTSPGVPGSPPSPLRDRRVREAMALAIDNGLIVRTVMNGNALAAGQLLPEGVTGHIPDYAAQKRPDVERARALLAEAGYPDGFDVRLDGPNDRYVNDAQILQAVAQQLARVGVRVAVAAQPKARFFSEERQGNCSFFLLGWSNTHGDGAATFEHLLHTPDPARGLGGANACTQYSNPAIDKLTDEAATQFDPAARKALLQEANRLAMADWVHIPLHFQMDIYAVAPRIHWTPRRDTQVRGVDIRLEE